MYIYYNIRLNYSQNEMFQTKAVEKSKHILCSVTFLNRPFYETMWKNMVMPERSTDDNIIGRMRIACWIPRGTDTHTQNM